MVRDLAVHLEVLEHFLEYAKENHFTVLDITYSPIRGPEGNIEYLVHLEKCDPSQAAVEDGIAVETVVSEAFEALRG